MGLELPADSLPLVALSPEAAFSFSPADAPPEALDSLEPAPLGDPALLSLFALSLPEDSEEVLSPVVPVVPVVLVDVVEVEVVWMAAFSALVSVGGVMLGVLFGTASETLLLPQAPSVSTARSATHAVSAMRILTAAPCAFRRWGSR